MEGNSIPIQTTLFTQRRDSHFSQNYHYYLMHLSNPPKKKGETQAFRYISTGDQFVFLSPGHLSAPLQSCADRRRQLAFSNAGTAGWDKQFDWEGKTQGLWTGRIILSIKCSETATN